MTAMDVSSSTESSWSTMRGWIKRPIVAGSLIVGYLILVIVALLSLDRGNLLFPLYSTLVFPPFVLSPLVIISSPLNNRVKGGLVLFVLLLAMPLVGIYDSTYL